MLGIPSQVRNELHTGGSRSDERDTLVGELVQAASGVSAGVVVVPAGRMENASLEILEPGDPGQLRSVVRALRHDDEAGADVVAAVGGQPPAVDRLVPPH